MSTVFLAEAETPGVMGLTEFLDVLGQVITAVIKWVVQVLTTITSNPILLVPFGVVACYTAIKLLKKIF